MRGVNKVILVGNLGQDPDVRKLPSGTTVANCSLATSSVWTDSSGQRNEKVEWHRLVMFNRLAEIVEQYLHKGSSVYIEGALQTNKWEKDGTTMYTTEVVVRDMQMLGRRNDSGGNYERRSSNYGSGNDSNQSQQEPRQDRHSSQPKQQPQPQQDSSVPFDDFDDDIPF